MKRVVITGPNAIATEDGGASLTRIGADSSRDGGGYIYKFENKTSSNTDILRTFKVLIGDVTVFSAKSYYEKEGKDFRSLSLSESDSLVNIFSQKYGRIFLVKSIFDANFGFHEIDRSERDEIIHIFCRLYFELLSIKRSENSNEQFERNEKLEDRIRFSPPEIPMDYWFVITAQEVLGQ